MAEPFLNSPCVYGTSRPTGGLTLSQHVQLTQSNLVRLKYQSYARRLQPFKVHVNTPSRMPCFSE
ncbi:unnamed protein product, partial [Prunus brigantina]